MKATSYAVWRVLPILWLALGVCTPYASGQGVMNIQQATLMEQAKAVAYAVAREAFHNVSYFAGPLERLRTAAVR